MKFDEVSKNFEKYSVVNPFKIATDAEIFPYWEKSPILVTLIVKNFNALF